MGRRARVFFFRQGEALGGPMNEISRPTEERALDQSIRRPMPVGQPGLAKRERPKRVVGRTVFWRVGTFRVVPARDRPRNAGTLRAGERWWMVI